MATQHRSRSSSRQRPLSNGGGGTGRRTHNCRDNHKRRGAQCCRRFTAFLFSHVGLCALVVGYAVLGAFTFRALEAQHEVQRADEVQRLRDVTVDSLWEITNRYNVLYRENWTVEVGREMADFQRGLIEAVKDGYDGRPSGQGQRWTLSGAFLYSLTVITTIGQ
ncbi:potassium channel subfamily K member 18-like [Tropilaelaps mercedesae]|uniref:Potassium channel subfamily K member 18-like n=1 Tax=Tropilaelaps mercedesae TaxID=418985 RepID=A0A1V9XDF8_9ACAR|nr:potassium channel subfamily K member 18-like [Tropilaelaps mercedesae]